MEGKKILLIILLFSPILSFSQSIEVDTFYFTGSLQTFVVTPVMASGPIHFDIRGGNGGDLLTGLGGNGGRVVCDIQFNAGDQLEINVGGAGASNVNTQGGVFVGSGGVTPNGFVAAGNSGTGGGASDIRLNGSTLADRIIVAGGGGGAGGGTMESVDGGDGGGLTGADGMLRTFLTTANGKGGTQTAGGASGTIGTAPACANAINGTFGLGGTGTGDATDGGGGGGGGYYGGGGSCTCGGGGGSSYTAAIATNVSHNQGFQSGNGMVILTYNSCFSSNETLTICDSMVSPSGNYTWTTSGIYNDTISSSFGCPDTLLALDLTVLNSVDSVFSLTACEIYVWPENGDVYINSGQYSVMFESSTGCDSSITLDLNIMTPVPYTDSIEVCESYTWPINGQTYTSSSNSLVYGGGAMGCDTIYSLVLTINNSTSNTEAITACGAYTWPVTGLTYTIDDQITEILTSAEGCDSIRILDLTIISVDSTVTDLGNNSLSANASSANFQWLDCEDSYTVIQDDTNQVFIITEAGSFAVEITQNGCIDTSACYSSSLSIHEVISNQIEIFPNPTQKTVNVDLGRIYKSIEIKVTDVSGRLIQSHQFKNKQLLSLDLEGSVGYFNIEIATESGLKINRLIIKE